MLTLPAAVLSQLLVLAALPQAPRAQIHLVTDDVRRGDQCCQRQADLPSLQIAPIETAVL